MNAVLKGKGLFGFPKDFTHLLRKELFFFLLVFLRAGKRIGPDVIKKYEWKYQSPSLYLSLNHFQFCRLNRAVYVQITQGIKNDRLFSSNFLNM